MQLVAPEDPSLIPIIHIGKRPTTVMNSSSKGFSTVFWPLKAPGMYVVHITHRQKK